MDIGRIRLPRPLVLVAVTLMVAVGLVAGLSLNVASGSGIPGPPSASIGDQLDRPLPADLATAAFTDQQGRPVDLRQFSGRAVLLVPFLTSCQEECPVTTGALLELQRSLRTDKIAEETSIIEVTVDPGRDSPSRLAAYAHLTGSDWPLLTSSRAVLARLWRYFGVYYQRVAEDSPSGVDWESGRPYAYDVDHSDGFILLDQKLRERFFAGGMARIADVTGRVRSLLDAQGVQNLRHPGGGSWTVSDALDAIGWVLQRPIARAR